MKNLKKLLSAAVLMVCLCSADLAHAQKGTLNDIKFLDGRWLGTYNGGPIEAAWTAPAGNNIVGYIRMMKDEKATLYEMFVFEQNAEGPVAMVKHFKPGMIGVEEKDAFDRYTFQSAKKNEALFEKDDASVRIIYELRNKDQLVIQRGRQENGQWKFVDLFVFNRIP